MPQRIKVIAVPYHLAEARVGMGRGPEAYLEAGAAQRLRETGHEVSTEVVEPRGSFGDQIAFILNLQQQVAKRVNEALSRNHFPLILSGNCSASIGALGGFAPQQVGLIWFDAHGDFNTPSTSPSGFFDGMGLAVIAGLCFPEFSKNLGGGLPLSASRIVHLGSRDLDPGEIANFKNTGVTVISAAQIQQAGATEALKPALKNLSEKPRAVHLHLDIDVLNSQDYPAHEFPAPGGLSLEELVAAIDFISQSFSIQSATLSAYNPGYDPTGKTLRAGLRLMEMIAGYLD